MNCPICNIPLNITERQGVEIDFIRNVAVCGWTGASWTRLLSVQHRKCLPIPIRSGRMTAMISVMTSIKTSIAMIITAIIRKRNEGFSRIYLIDN